MAGRYFIITLNVLESHVGSIIADLKGRARVVGMDVEAVKRTQDVATLILIALKDGPLSRKELAERIGVTTTPIVTNVDKLRARKLVSKIDAPNPKQVRWAITAEGKKVAAAEEKKQKAAETAAENKQ